jgi:hypothetical protein
LGVDLTVSGGRELDAAAARLAREARRFQRRVSQATRDAVQSSYRPVLVGMTPQFVPNRYAAALGPDLRVATTVSLTAGRVTARVSAPGAGKVGRDVRKLEAGVLAHPLFGNRGFYKSRADGKLKSAWFRQRVRRGFASVPLRAIRPHIVKRIEAELRAIARDVEK